MDGIRTEGEKLNMKCSHGECPIYIDSMSPCPVMELANKPCMEICLEDWIHWLKHEEEWSHHFK